MGTKPRMAPLEKDAEERLRLHLARMRLSSPQDLVSPLIRKRAEIIGPTAAREEMSAEVWHEADLSLLPMWLRDLEAKQRGKHGSYSDSPGYYTPGGLATGCATFYREPIFKWQIPAAKRHANRILRSVVQGGKTKGSLDPVSLDLASADFVGRTNLGWPFFSSNPKYIPLALDMSRDLLCDLSLDSINLYPAVLNTRGQPSGPWQKAKGRVVFGCSRVVANLEKMVFRPLFEHLCGPWYFSAWQGQRSVDYSIGRILNQAHKRSQPILSIDYSNFDATVPPMVIDSVFDAIETVFTPSALGLLRFLREYFKGVRIVTPSWEEISEERKRGIPSGSVLTNLVGSLANIWMVAYAASVHDTTISECQVQGDDGVYLFQQRGPVSPESLSRVLAEHLDVSMSADKQHFDHGEVHFLQNVHRLTYVDGYGVHVGVRPIMRVLNGMMSYERFRPSWTPYMDTLRWFQQIETASSHPSFRGFVDWFRAKDKYSNLPVDQLIALAGGYEIVNSNLGGGYWSNKVPVEAITRSRVARVIAQSSGSTS
jgi:hypothetical protein